MQCRVSGQDIERTAIKIEMKEFARLCRGPLTWSVQIAWMPSPRASPELTPPSLSPYYMSHSPCCSSLVHRASLVSFSMRLLKLSLLTHSLDVQIGLSRSWHSRPLKAFAREEEARSWRGNGEEKGGGRKSPKRIAGLIMHAGSFGSTHSTD